MNTWIDVPAAQRPGNVMNTRALLAAGHSTADIRTMVRRGVLTRLRRGWYAGHNPHPQVVRAVCSGGVLGCVSALTFHGAWRPLSNRLHVYRHDKPKRPPPGEHRWCPTPELPASGGAVVPVDLAVRQALLCVSTEEVLVQVESLIRSRVLTFREAECLLGTQAGKLDVSESGTETMVRHRLRARGIRLRPQAPVPGGRRVDLLVGDRLVIEVDSHEHHRSSEAYQRDRLRDLELVALGYLVVRVTWEQVHFRWAEAEDWILRIIRERRHRGRPRPR